VEFSSKLLLNTNFPLEPRRNRIDRQSQTRTLNRVNETSATIYEPKSTTATLVAYGAMISSPIIDLTKSRISCQLLPPGGSLSRMLPELSITNARSTTHAAIAYVIMHVIVSSMTGTRHFYFRPGNMAKCIRNQMRESESDDGK